MPHGHTPPIAAGHKDRPKFGTRQAEGPVGCGRVEVEYVDPSRGRERRPLAACWSSRFERMSPVRGFASFQGQRNWPG